MRTVRIVEVVILQNIKGRLKVNCDHVEFQMVGKQDCTFNGLIKFASARTYRFVRSSIPHGPPSPCMLACSLVSKLGAGTKSIRVCKSSLVKLTLANGKTNCFPMDMAAAAPVFDGPERKPFGTLAASSRGKLTDACQLNSSVTLRKGVLKGAMWNAGAASIAFHKRNRSLFRLPAFALRNGLQRAVTEFDSSRRCEAVRAEFIRGS